MCFSSQFWRTEPHSTYFISYLHWGDSKIWYASQPNSFDAFESTVLKCSSEDLSETTVNGYDKQSLQLDFNFIRDNLTVRLKFIFS